MFLILLTTVSLASAIVLGAVTWRLVRAERRRSEARVAALATAIDGPASAAPSLFVTPPRSAVQGRPLLKVAIGFAMAVTVIVVLAMTGGRHDAPAARATGAVTTSQESLELLSMRHTRAGDALMVTGLVRNAGAAAPDAITAVVFAFDSAGGFVASGQAPLEFRTLAPGDESPFQVTIPHVAGVGRYRVSFRTAGGVLKHVDRRPNLQVSTN